MHKQDTDEVKDEVGKEEAPKFVDNARAGGNGEKCKAGSNGSQGHKSHARDKAVENGHPSIESETAEKFGPLPEEETEKLLEWLRLGSQCIRLKFGRRTNPLTSYGC